MDDSSTLLGLAEDIERFDNREQLAAILDSGANPEDFLSDYESKLHVAEGRAIADYIAEADNLLELNVNIEKCDEVLQALEEVLRRFDQSLGSASDEILCLQRKSEGMRRRMENGKSVQGHLSSFIEKIVVLPSLIEDVMKAHVSSKRFEDALTTLDDKLRYVDEHEDVRMSAAFRDVAIEMERLRLAAVKRCRDFLMDKMYEMRHPNSNIQVQQNVLIRYTGMISFLRVHGHSMYDEIYTTYIASVTSKFMEIFRNYWASMEGLEETIVPPDLLLGSPASAGISQGLSSMVSLFNSMKKVTSGEELNETLDQHEAFQLSDRLDVLDHLHDNPIIPSARQAKRPFEYLFASLSRLLVDTAAHEYLFCKNFWQKDGRKIFKDVFKPVVDFIHGSLNASFQEQNDLIALLLCIKINRENFLTMSKRRNPALDEHFDAVNLLLWPRVKHILDRHLASVQPTEYTGNEGTDITAHTIVPLSRRYASLMASILILNAHLVEGSLSLNIEQLKYAVINVLLTTSRQLPKRGEGTIFLLHNFHHIISVLKCRVDEADSRQEDETHNPILPFGKQVLESFEDAFSRALDLYVESRIQAGVPHVSSFVRRGEAAVAKDANFSESLDHNTALQVALEFSGRWDKVLSVLNKEIQKDFSDEPLFALVQKTAHSKILLLWSRFVELLKKMGEPGEDIVRRSISIPSIMQTLRNH